VTNSDPTHLVLFPQCLDPVDDALFPSKNFGEVAQRYPSDDVWTTRACAFDEETVGFFLYI
jgi:hypothetical protein